MFLKGMITERGERNEGRVMKNLPVKSLKNIQQVRREDFQDSMRRSIQIVSESVVKKLMGMVVLEGD